ncbi:MAG: hypothetical protein COU06_01645 [Candidatus Harrisonbacteria bacterium CG10_big_fil_rev_8_21_14_0_10_38_8]|uniref:Uncharacterized protein n=1 Tax=Candidatus Harrisonbacteria bacterium CG10_big_fil_rev_8_21_14_0_10_38_8 TaxID=1974582 RepID=A0A2M6WJZ2_9BACT|nr:MAG: hypothetical protein COU06_01645 [Candidatus Harrisonbacteria bacterium CG10_big_fil_rev_8_21_14_0_10_38_8]
MERKRLITPARAGRRFLDDLSQLACKTRLLLVVRISLEIKKFFTLIFLATGYTPSLSLALR